MQSVIHRCSRIPIQTIEREPALRAKWNATPPSAGSDSVAGSRSNFVLTVARAQMGKADLKLPENGGILAITFSACFYKLTLLAGTFKQRGSFTPAVD